MLTLTAAEWAAIPRDSKRTGNHRGCRAILKLNPETGGTELVPVEVLPAPRNTTGLRRGRYATVNPEVIERLPEGQGDA